MTNNYVEDDENMFRFDYSEFLRWALRPPGYFKSWNISVWVKTTRKLMGFITRVLARFGTSLSLWQRSISYVSIRSFGPRDLPLF